ncbi:polysaccharide deacetylase family protein [Neobacillus cucumis]|uniref:polysaccharide deacetylase family protein n=1 Tax=Neobacillus cucumis TaxID=1740721 RepID=UPI0018DF98DD|nr:polysaccharide deacetylase family protein [Neobacillus cucumis]MBI0577215.1 polysaccharide deacetylase family protein [Neobacillus cucumis]WHY94279.1 polysaccharide deacetylase family protein [Neobacillus cucumis]
MRKRMLISAVILLVLFLTFYGTYKLMNSRTYQVFGGITDHVKTNKKVVALTFDDGPTGNVDNILPLLDQYDAKATFFLIGNELRQHPEQGLKIAEAGHQIGNHTYSHKRMIFKSPDYIKREIEQTDMLIRKTGYKGEIDVRPPNGKKLVGLPFYLKKHHRDTITWNLEPDTYYTSIKDKVTYVKQNIKPGSIILLHPMYDQTGNEQKTIEGILKELTEKGYKFVTVNELQNEF